MRAAPTGAGTEQRLSVAVAALTYDRPHGLARLLDGVAQQSAGPGRDAVAVIVDNHPDATARALVETRAGAFPMPLVYVHEPRRGLAYARNRALEEAGRLGAERIAFIDDDEAPREGWLAALMQAMDATGAAVVVGPVEPVYGAPPPSWMIRGGVHAFGRGFAEDRPPPHCTTANSMIDLRFLSARGLRFDPVFSFTGGEDTDLFSRIAAAGGGLRFCRDAAVEETITPERATLGWLWRRWRRTGNSDGLIRLRRAPGAATRARLLGGGLGRVAIAGAAAAATAPCTLFGRGDIPAEQLRRTARGLGFLAAALGRAQAEYAEGARAESAPAGGAAGSAESGG